MCSQPAARKHRTDWGNHGPELAEWTALVTCLVGVAASEGKGRCVRHGPQWVSSRRVNETGRNQGPGTESSWQPSECGSGPGEGGGGELPLGPRRAACGDMKQMGGSGKARSSRLVSVCEAGTRWPAARIQQVARF